MFDVIKDLYHNYDEEIKKIELNQLSAIYIKPNSKITLFFERFNDLWTYEENNKGKYDYIIDLDSTFETLINQLKEKYEFDDNFIFRLYEYNENSDSFIKFIVPTNRKLINQEIFGNYELSRLNEINEKEYEKNNPEELKDFKNQMEILSTDVIQLLKLISAQGHNEETLRVTMTILSNILSNIPITDITDDEEHPNDWIKLSEDEFSDIVKKMLIEDNIKIFDIYLNIRCTRIIKVIYKNEKNENITEYFDINSAIFINKEDNEQYFSEESIECIDIPWSYKPTREIPIDIKTRKEKMYKISEMIKY